MDSVDDEKCLKKGSHYERCLVKAMDRTRQLFLAENAAQDYEKIHALKSILYAAIEQAGMESERLISAQELLRELLTLVALQIDPVQHERQEVFKILEKLKTHHFSSGENILKSQISNLK